MTAPAKPTNNFTQGIQETPAHPKVEPLEKIRPATPYMLTIDDVREFPRYEKTWKEIFQIR